MSEFEGLTKEYVFRPAFDKRHADPKKNYGIHGVEMVWYLKGPKGAVQFVVYTNWHLPHVQAELDANTSGQFPHLSCHPMGADIGYHAHCPQYDGQSVMRDQCDLIGGPCWYDGSSLSAEKLLNTLICEGQDAVWDRMKERYDDLKVPEVTETK